MKSITANLYNLFRVFFPLILIVLMLCPASFAGAVRTDWSKTGSLQKMRKSSAVKQTESLASVSVFSNMLVSTSMQFFSSQNQTRLGESVTFTAVVSISEQGAPPGIQPTGTVVFFAGGGTIGSAAINNGVAVLTTSALRVGSYSVGGSYSGDSVFAGSGKSIFHEVLRGLTRTTILGPSQVATGITVRYTAAVQPFQQSAPIPTGTVSFVITNVGSNVPPQFCTDAPLTNGFAVCDITFNVTGDYRIQTVYSGDANFESIDPRTVAERFVTAVVPVPTTTTVNSSANSSLFGQPVTFTAAAVTAGMGNPTGTVQFFDGENPISAPIPFNPSPFSVGPVQVTTSALSPGIHTIRAQYLSNSVYGNSSSTLTHTVALAPTAATVSISGRVTSMTGRGIINVRLTLTDSSGQVRTAMTTTSGYYRFDDVQAGETYILSATGKRFTFSQPVQVLNVNEETNEVNFTANSEKRLRAF